MAQQPLLSKSGLDAPDAIRAKNGFRILVAAFATLVIAFLILLSAFGILSSNKIYALAPSDVIALFGALTAVVGTLVGTYFGVSAANGARDAATNQAKSASDIAHRAFDQLR
jgi:hypothetical protein